VQQAKQALNLNDANIKELEEGLRRFQDQGSLTRRRRKHGDGHWKG
jgi:hypothetical protein